MSNDDIPAPPSGIGRSAKRRSATKMSPHRAAYAEQRRAAFLRFLDERDLKPAELARLAGLPAANAIYNFIKGRAASLSQNTIERILAVMPGTTMADLMGPPRPSSQIARPASLASTSEEASPSPTGRNSTSAGEPADRDDLALDVTFELQPLNDAITSLGVAVEGAETGARAIGPSDSAADVGAAWMSHNTLVRERFRLVEAHAAAFIQAAMRLVVAR